MLYLSYIEHLLYLVSAVTECVYISDFASLLGIPTGIASSAVRLTNCAVTAGIKKCKSIIKKKRRKQDKIVLLVKTKLKSIELFRISSAVIDSCISRREFVSVNNVLKDYDNTKKAIKI